MAILLAIPAVFFVVAQLTAGVEASELGAPVFERLDVPLDASPQNSSRRLQRSSMNSTFPRKNVMIEHSGHWSAMAGFAIGLVVMAFLVAIRVRGSRVTAWSVGLAVAYYGIVSLATPDDASSAGSIAGILCVLWGVAFVALAERDARVTGGQLLAV